MNYCVNINLNLKSRQAIRIGVIYWNKFVLNIYGGRNLRKLKIMGNKNFLCFRDFMFSIIFLNLLISSKVYYNLSRF